MSLISEALKAAQRERTERDGPRTQARVAEGFFPYPRAGKGRSSNMLVIGAGIAVIALVVAGATYTTMHGRGTPVRRPAISNAATALPTPRPTAPVAHDTAHAATVAPPTAEKTTKANVAPPQGAATKGTPAQSHVLTKHDSIVARTTSTVPSTGKPTATPSPATSAAPSSPSAPLPAVPQGATTNPPLSAGGGHVVVDPVGLRPGDSLFARAYTEQQRGNLDVSQDLYEQAVRTGQVSPELYTDFGALLVARRNYDAALPMLSRAIQLDDKNVNAWINLGDAYNSLGKSSEAIAAFGHAHRLDETNPAVMVRLANQYAAIGDTAGARRMFDDAVRVAPKDPATKYAYGAFLAHQGDYAGAVAQLDEFLTLAPGHYPDATVQTVRNYVASLRRRIK